DSLRSTEVYQTTLPSFLAASINAGVTAVAGGVADMTLVENTARTASALEPTSTSRREIFERFIDVSSVALISRLPPTYYPLSARQRSGGRCSQTALPSGMFSLAPVRTRSCVPSFASTI